MNNDGLNLSRVRVAELLLSQKNQVRKLHDSDADLLCCSLKGDGEDLFMKKKKNNA